MEVVLQDFKGILDNFAILVSLLVKYPEFGNRLKGCLGGVLDAWQMRPLESHSNDSQCAVYEAFKYTLELAKKKEKFPESEINVVKACEIYKEYENRISNNRTLLAQEIYTLGKSYTTWVLQTIFVSGGGYLFQRNLLQYCDSMVKLLYAVRSLVIPAIAVKTLNHALYVSEIKKIQITIANSHTAHTMFTFKDPEDWQNFFENIYLGVVNTVIRPWFPQYADDVEWSDTLDKMLKSTEDIADSTLNLIPTPQSSWSVWGTLVDTGIKMATSVTDSFKIAFTTRRFLQLSQRASSLHIDGIMFQ